MAFIAVPNAARVVVGISQGSKLMTTPWHVAKVTPAPFTASDLIVAVNVFKTWWTGTLGPLLSSSVSLTSIVATGMDNVNSPQSVGSGLGQAGGVAGNMAPIGACCCVSHYTQTRGKGFRGRWYAGGLPDTFLSANGMMDPTKVAPLVATVGTLSAALIAANPSMNLVIVSTRLNHAPRAAGLYTPWFNSVSRNNVFRYQRRREQDHKGRL